MFFPKHSPLHASPTSQNMRAEFSLLSWNIQKLSLDNDFSPLLSQLIQHKQLDFIVLQEVKLSNSSPFPLVGKDYSFYTAPNIQTKKHIYGVMTATHHPFLSHQKFLSDSKEALLTTRKSALVTSHPMLDGSSLLLANLHAINFVPLVSFKKQMLQLYAALKDHPDAMILCGDFNTWNKQRFNVLNQLCQTLHLQIINFPNPHKIKHFLSHPLDHVFYRCLELQQCEVLDSGNFSDHNPLLIRFKCLT